VRERDRSAESVGWGGENVGSAIVLLLALDTATPAVTVAVHDGNRVLSTRSTVDARRHGELLVPMLSDVLTEAGAVPRDITDIAVGVGPGPFTGLRVGLVTARTTASVVGAVVHGVCSLDTLAAAVGSDGPFVVATDARRHEVHWAAYDATGRRTDGPAVDRPGDLAARLGADVPVVGRGAALYADDLRRAAPPLDGPLDPDAGVLAQAVVDGRVELLPVEPLYLRRPDAQVPGPMKPVVPQHRRRRRAGP